MELKAGYKNTEVGVIPEDWSVSRLDELIYLLTDYESNGSFASLAENVSPVNQVSFAWLVRSTDIENDTHISNVRYVDESSYRFLKKTSLFGGELLFLKKGDVGRVYLFELKTKYATLADNLYLLNLNNKTNSIFLYNYFKSEIGQSQIKSRVAASSIPALYKDEVKSILVPLPMLTEQTAIATALSDADALISSLEKLISKKRNIKQGAMQKLLQPKEGWEVKKLGEVIISFQNGYGFSASGYSKSGIPIITMAQIGLDGSFNFDETKVNFWNVEDFYSLRNFHVEDRDLIIAMTDVTPEKNLIGRMAIVKSDLTFLLNQRVGLLRIDSSKVNSYFLKTLSNMRGWRTYCIGSASLGVQANLGTKDILNGILQLPVIEDQNKIAKILSDMDAEITALEAKLEKYKKVKLGMMQNLLTGKIRLV